MPPDPRAAPLSSENKNSDIGCCDIFTVGKKIEKVGTHGTKGATDYVEGFSTRIPLKITILHSTLILCSETCLFLPV